MSVGDPATTPTVKTGAGGEPAAAEGRPEAGIGGGVEGVESLGGAGKGGELGRAEEGEDGELDVLREVGEGEAIVVVVGGHPRLLVS